MTSKIDEKKGLVKCYWVDIRDQVAKVAPKFAELVDAKNVDNSFPLYKAYYAYGDITCDTQTPFLPHMEGGYYRLNKAEAPADVYKDLGYGETSLPLGMLLEKQLHYFIDFKNEQISIPWRIYNPGAIFPMARILSSPERFYAPNGVTTVTSGARSIFMLPNIGCATQHSNLQRDFNINAAPPKTLYEQFDIFKRIYDSQIIPCDWRSCILYFSEKWLDHIYSDPDWQDIKLYFYERAWLESEYHRNKIYYDIIFSVIQRERNLKPNPYLVDTAQHLFTTALGDTPGYIPATTDDALPLDLIQQAYIESYGLKKYIPTIMAPYDYQFETDKQPIYYSLQNPTTYIFSPKSRKISSTLYDLRELEHIIDIFTQELRNDEQLAYNTVLNQLAKAGQFKYFHNKIDNHGVITPSTEIPKFDARFNYVTKKTNLASTAKFACDAPFVRGCISIAT